MRSPLHPLVAAAAVVAPPLAAPLAAQDPAPGFVAANGARLHYLDFGGRGEPVVLLAGLGNGAWIWSDFGPRLARAGFRVVALTRRAHGESSAPADGYGLDTLAADVVAFMDSLGLRRAHLVGHSLAGAELTRIAARHPARVLRLVYVDAAYDRAAQRRLDAADPPPELAPPITAADRRSVGAYLAYQRRARPDLARFWGTAVERDFRASLAADSAGAVRWRHPFAHYGAMLDDAARAAPEYDRVRAPALALYATVSQTILPPDATAEQRAQAARFERENNGPWLAASEAQFRTGVRGGRVARIAGVHHLFLDRPDETLRAIVPFLRGTAR
ncbi:alpha/beta hydrolase [Roseisolibacter sp. H3M3-2]|uniref:alpha/beta fold hydrolase n=1 Tax=Roseisolibacter sp. H3M3-2 TaxID=3031323 RepID=UPI0023DC6E5D|nr:alpha/beta hydrolase [Roseisolibacter sp. H3M3-2]MDF1504637.1 alpha/beta hydrolase [Roseisolibacter sp. H3M3-2]